MLFRSCLCCNLAIGDERHFICDCPLYVSERDGLKQMCIEYNRRVTHQDSTRTFHQRKPTIDVNSEGNFFVDVMRETDGIVINALSDFVWKAFDKRTEFLKLR